jgi:hypothetical protein
MDRAAQRVDDFAWRFLRQSSLKAIVAANSRLGILPSAERTLSLRSELFA